MDFHILRGESLYIYVSAEENSAVQIAAGNLVRDLSAVVGAMRRYVRAFPMPDRAWPAMDYLFIGSTPLAHIKND